MTVRFAPVTRRSLADDVRQQLELSIRSGALAPGVALPREATLCAEFAVSRASVRAAIRDLVLLGLVVRQGGRAHVVEHLPDVRLAVDGRAARIREVFETRRLIEVQVTEWAAERATADQRREITASAARMAQASDVETLRPLDRAFHAVIAAACGNALLAELHGKVLDAVFATPPFETLLRATGDARATARVLRATAASHEAIAAAIAAGDPAAAANAARAHLDDVEQRLLPPG